MSAHIQIIGGEALHPLLRALVLEMQLNHGGELTVDATFDVLAKLDPEGGEGARWELVGPPLVGGDGLLCRAAEVPPLDRLDRAAAANPEVRIELATDDGVVEWADGKRLS